MYLLARVGSGGGRVQEVAAHPSLDGEVGGVKFGRVGNGDESVGAVQPKALADDGGDGSDGAGLKGAVIGAGNVIRVTVAGPKTNEAGRGGIAELSRSADGQEEHRREDGSRPRARAMRQFGALHDEEANGTSSQGQRGGITETGY